MSIRKLSWNCAYKDYLISGLEKYLGKSYVHLKKIVGAHLVRNVSFACPTGNPGSGVGRGGGGGGSVRSSGGGLGEYGAAQEEQFFFNKQREQLEKIKKKMKDMKSDLRKEDK